MDKTATTPGVSGVFAALATPRRRNTVAIDTAQQLEYLDRISAAGVDGLVFFGSTGEFVHFSIEDRMLATALAAKRSRVPFLVNVSHSTFSGVRDLAAHALDNGAAGLLIMPPYFYRYEDAEIETFYCEIADAIDAAGALYLYNLPQFVPAISTPLLEKLLMSGRFAGIKDSSGEWQTFEFLRSLRVKSNFELFTGHEQIYAQALQSGVRSIVSGIAAAVPELIVAVKRAASDSNPQILRDASRRVEEFLGWIRQFPTTIAIKEAAEMRGFFLSVVAAPLSKETTAKLTAFREWFHPWLVETLQFCATISA